MHKSVLKERKVTHGMKPGDLVYAISSFNNSFRERYGTGIIVETMGELREREPDVPMVSHAAHKWCVYFSKLGTSLVFHESDLRLIAEGTKDNNDRD